MFNDQWKVAKLASRTRLRIRLMVFTLALGRSSLSAQSNEEPWQHIQMPTIKAVERAWAIPPPEYGPEPYYGLSGLVDQVVIGRDLDTMKALGFGAVTAQAGYGMTAQYLSPEYFQFFRMLVSEVKKRNLRLWIVDDAGYPSGFAGGRFSESRPDLRMQGLIVKRQFAAKGGDTIAEAVGPDTVVVTAMNTATQAVLTVPSANNSIDWVVPAGEWTISIVLHRFVTSPTRSDTNPKRVKDGSQSLEDYLNPDATRAFLEFTHEQYKKAVGEEFGKTILGFRGDEPDYSISGLPWTPAFFDTFMRLKGYDVRPLLASLLTPVAPNQEPPRATQLVRADYFDVFSQMFRDGFFKPQGEWCAAHHLEYQVHLNHEEQQLQLVRSEGSFFRDMQYVQVPGIDAIWHQIWTDTVSDFPRLASSAAHLYGHPRAFTESFAAYRPEPDVAIARYILNEQLVRGINLVETMYFPATSAPGHGGPATFMRDPAYPALMRYTRRLSYLMSMGRPAASVALLLPTASLWMGDAKADDTFVSTERLLSEHQIDFDVVDEDAISRVLRPGPGLFETLSGNRLRTVIVPGGRVLSQATLDRLRTFSAGGGHVLFVDGEAQLIAGRTYADARPSGPKDFSWASTFEAALGHTPTPPAQPPVDLPPAEIDSMEVRQALQKAVPQNELVLATADKALRYTHRVVKNATIFLLFNESATPIENIATLQAKGKRVQLWDAETALSTSIDGADFAKDSVRLPFKLGPYATVIIVVR